MLDLGRLIEGADRIYLLELKDSIDMPEEAL